MGSSEASLGPQVLMSHLSRVASHVHVLMCALAADRGSCEQMRAIALLGSP